MEKLPLNAGYDINAKTFVKYIEVPESATLSKL